eukprot:g23646.t1
MEEARELQHVSLLSTTVMRIAVDTDNNRDATIITKAPWEFQVAENLFCTFFTLEWLVRLFAFRRKIMALTDAWFVLDTLLVSLMIVETWITTLGQVKSRMTRVAKLLRAFPEVLIMIKGISAASRSVMFTICLLILVLYASITLMNMLIGVLCEVVSMVGQSEREELLVELVKRELLDIIIEADEDGDGLMSHAEFLKRLECTSKGLARELTQRSGMTAE